MVQTSNCGITVSLVDGFDLPMSITNNKGCPVADCSRDLNANCNSLSPYLIFQSKGLCNFIQVHLNFVVPWTHAVLYQDARAHALQIQMVINVSNRSTQNYQIREADPCISQRTRRTVVLDLIIRLRRVHHLEYSSIVTLRMHVPMRMPMRMTMLLLLSHATLGRRPIILLRSVLNWVFGKQQVY